MLTLEIEIVFLLSDKKFWKGRAVLVPFRWFTHRRLEGPHFSFFCCPKFSGGICCTAAQLLPLGPRSEKRPHLDRRPTSNGGLAAPCQRLVQIGGFQHPQTAHALLGLQVRPVGDLHLTTCARNDLALLAGCRPPTKILTPAAFISSLSASISRHIASSSTTDGS